MLISKHLITMHFSSERQKRQTNGAKEEQKGNGCERPQKRSRITNNGEIVNERGQWWSYPPKCKGQTERKRSHEHLLSLLLPTPLILFSWEEQRRWVKEGWSIMNCELPLSGAVWLLAVDKAQLWQPYSTLSSIIIYRDGEDFHT